MLKCRWLFSGSEVQPEHLQVSWCCSFSPHWTAGTRWWVWRALWQQEACTEHLQDYRTEEHHSRRKREDKHQDAKWEEALLTSVHIHLHGTESEPHSPPASPCFVYLTSQPHSDKRSCLVQSFTRNSGIQAMQSSDEAERSLGLPMQQSRGFLPVSDLHSLCRKIDGLQVRFSGDPFSRESLNARLPQYYTPECGTDYLQKLCSIDSGVIY